MKEITLTGDEMQILQTQGMIQALRSLRARTGLGLREAMEAVKAAKEGRQRTQIRFVSKAGNYNRRVTETEVYAMAGGEVERQAIAEAVGIVVRHGVPLTLHLGTQGLTESGRKRVGRRVNISLM